MLNDGTDYSDEKYQARGRAVADSLNTFLKVNNAFAGTNDVTNKTTSFVVDTESFFYAELMNLDSFQILFLPKQIVPLIHNIAAEL
ncbi:hypothetical protein DFH11DRAFT_1878095 [Phellopilus nigrolimitatus]|nr:hypothetical protein DFH11DRAFT_1878095 [Phellopilus nigrolimitatus]